MLSVFIGDLRTVSYTVPYVKVDELRRKFQICSYFIHNLHNAHEIRFTHLMYVVLSSMCIKLMSHTSFKHLQTWYKRGGWDASISGEIKRKCRRRGGNSWKGVKTHNFRTQLKIIWPYYKNKPPLSEVRGPY